MAHGDARKRKWRGNWQMEWVASTLNTTSERGVSSITTAGAHASAANSRLNWRPRRFKWTRPFRRKTKSGFCACAITFQTHSTFLHHSQSHLSFPSFVIAKLPNNFENVTSVNTGKHKATQPTEPIPSWETNSRLANTITIFILWNPKLHCRIHNSPQLDLFVDQTDAVFTLSLL